MVYGQDCVWFEVVGGCVEQCWVGFGVFIIVYQVYLICLYIYVLLKLNGEQLLYGSMLKVEFCRFLVWFGYLFSRLLVFMVRVQLLFGLQLVEVFIIQVLLQVWLCSVVVELCMVNLLQWVVVRFSFQWFECQVLFRIVLLCGQLFLM